MNDNLLSPVVLKERYKYFVTRKEYSEPVKKCAAFLGTIVNFWHPDEHYQKDKQEEKNILLALESVQGMQNVTMSNESFEGHALLTTVLRRATMELNGTGKYISPFQPLWYIRDMVNGELHPQRHTELNLVLQECLNSLREEIRSASMIASDESAVMARY